MGSDNFKNTVISFLLLGVFMVLIVSIVSQMGINYDVSADKMNEATQGALDMEDYEAELLNSDEDSSQFRNRFESGDVDDVDDPSGIFSVAGDIIGVIKTPSKSGGKLIRSSSYFYSCNLSDIKYNSFSRDLVSVEEGRLIMTYPTITDINMTTSDGFSNLFQYINVVTNFWAGRGLMIAIFVLFLFGYLKSKNEDDFIGAFAVASYVTFVLGLFFWLINLLDGVTFGIIIGITIISTAILLFDKRGQ